MSYEGIDYNVQLIAFPSGKVKETITLNEDGSYTIFIDVNLNAERQKESLLHAMKHIIGEDFAKRNADDIELSTHILKERGCY